MFSSSIQLRVRYGETDRMGYAYYGNYAQYFEVARVEALRELGFTYKKLEDDGILLPVLNYSVKYISPAYYDDLITVRTYIKSVPSARIHFEYEVYNEDQKLITQAETTLVFISATNNKPCKPPQEMVDALAAYINT